MKSIKDLLLTLGIKDNYKGFHYLTDALELALADPNGLVSYSTVIFPLIARKHATNIHCVERNIRTVIKVCWNSEFREEIIRLCPYPLDGRPSVGEFLDILFWELSQQK